MLESSKVGKHYTAHVRSVQYYYANFTNRSKESRTCFRENKLLAKKHSESVAEFGIQPKCSVSPWLSPNNTAFLFEEKKNLSNFYFKLTIHSHSFILLIVIKETHFYGLV
jgi:hypothetical protein